MAGPAALNAMVEDATLAPHLRGRGLQIIGVCEHLSQREGLLQVSPILRDFTAEEADLLGANMLLVRARPGQLLIAEGEASDWMMMLLSGTVDVGKRPVGETEEAEATVTRLAVIKEGAVIGEMSMLDGEPRYASCRALSEVEAAVLTRGAVTRLIEKHPAVGAKLLVKLTQLLAQRLRNTSSKLVKVLQQQKPSGPGPETA
ncbi:Crp/Fnr family transcriptional regulator [Ramlibacter sp. PS4R-6]|uniref:Crp/Fnr family transcriptional regulator n=1 Tax=Ramlibacter sp. PS4R-6 TaxID=3133438 RepID=UPI0030B1EEDD